MCLGRMRLCVFADLDKNYCKYHYVKTLQTSSESLLY
jgi:hypothetical protein